MYTQQQLSRPLVSQFFTAVNSATKPTVVILNTYARFSNSLRANDDVFNGLVYGDVIV